jgi:hypothetical protein
LIQGRGEPAGAPPFDKRGSFGGEEGRVTGAGAPVTGQQKDPRERGRGLRLREAVQRAAEGLK